QHRHQRAEQVPEDARYDAFRRLRQDEGQDPADRAHGRPDAERRAGVAGRDQCVFERSAVGRELPLTPTPFPLYGGKGSIHIFYPRYYGLSHADWYYKRPRMPGRCEKSALEGV